MDDFELGLSSGSFFRDDFYESFQAPKFYDFINPRDSGNADEWFSRGLTLCGVKEVTTSSVPQSISENASYSSLKKPTIVQLWKEKSKNARDLRSGDSAEIKQCSENDDPNQGSRSAKLEKLINKEGVPNAESFKQDGKTRRKLHRAMPADEHSPVSRSKRLGTKGPFFVAPATVPQKKILAIRRAALEVKGVPVKSTASKALFENPRNEEPSGQAFRSQSDESDSSKEANSLSADPAPPVVEKNYSSGFEESCRRSGELPTCRRAMGQHRDSEAANYVVEQAVKLESAIKLLNLGDDEKNVKVCSEILGAVCTNGKPEQAKGASVQPDNSTFALQEGKHAFSFKATRQENTQHGRKRKSKELTAMTNRKGCCRKVATPTVCLAPPVATSSKPALVNSKKPRVTCPQPFRLRTEERGALKEIEFNKKVEHYLALREGLCSSAAPMPPSTAQIKTVAPLKKRPHRIQRSQTEEVSDKRSPVEVSIEMITKQITEQPEGAAPEERKARRPAMPSFHRPFRPQRSTKKLTVPIEPKFHTINGRRTCTKHSHVTAVQ